MNEASYTVSELQRKLAELDHKVWLYRRDMASEFEKYTDRLLQNISNDVTETIAQVMNESVNGYPSLYPDKAPIIRSRSLDRKKSDEEAINISYPQSRSERDSRKEVNPSRPNEHELELQGLFTPSYLPLLDFSSRERRSAPPGTSIRQYVDKSSGGGTDVMRIDASTEVPEFATPPSELRVQKPKRRFTDGFSQSSSIIDNGIKKRSALRRSSTSKVRSSSPRRVRFDVAGKQVLPTSSPVREAQFKLDEIFLSKSDSDENTDSDTIEELGESDPESEVPKRISSSQALRLLSRKSLEDDGTIWTTVGSNSDESSSVTDFSLNDQQEAEILKESSQKTLSLSQITLRKPMSMKNTHLDEDSLDNPPHRKKEVSQLQDFNDGVFSDFCDERRSYNHKEDFEDLFNFDELSLSLKRNEKFRHHEDSDDTDEDEFLTLKSKKFNSNQIHSNYHSESPALAIPRASTTAPESSSFCGLEGKSNRYHPFSLPIVRPEIHAQAAGLGHINTFVGSVDGRTGLDESGIKNYLGSIDSPDMKTVEDLKSGRPPKSLSERMVLEDINEDD